MRKLTFRVSDCRLFLRVMESVDLKRFGTRGIRNCRSGRQLSRCSGVVEKRADGLSPPHKLDIKSEKGGYLPLNWPISILQQEWLTFKDCVSVKCVERTV